MFRRVRVGELDDFVDVFHDDAVRVAQRFFRDVCSRELVRLHSNFFDDAFDVYIRRDDQNDLRIRAVFGLR